MTFFDSMTDKLRLNSVITKLIASFACISLIEIVSHNNNFNEAVFFNSIPLVNHLLGIALVFLTLMVLSYHRFYDMVEPFFVIFITLCLFFVTNCQAENIYYALISSAVMGGLIFYYTGRMKSFDLSKKVTILLCTIFGTLFVLFVGGLTILRYLNHWTPNFDFGIFSQMFYYMKETLIPYTTTERDRLLSHFAVHFSPIYYLILPIYMVFPSPATLLAVQAIAIALGIIPLYKLGKHYNLRNWAITLLVGVYVLFPALIGGNFYYFHENKLLTVLLLWLFYFIEKERNIPTAIFAVLVLMVKEDAPIYVAFIGLYILLSRRGAIRGTSLLGGSVIYFLVVTKLMTQYGEGIMSNRYNNYIFDPKGGLLSVVVNIIKNPAYLFTQILTEEKLIFLIYMFVPLAMIPLAIKKPSRIILILPLVLINIMPNYIYQYNIGYQYTYGSSAFLFYLAIMNLGEISPPISKRLLLSALAASMIFFAATHTDRINYVKSYIESREQIKAINEGLALIPKDKSVKACTFLVTPLSDRKVIYQYEYTKHTTEYVVLDLRYSTSEYNINDYRNSRYDEIYFVEGTIAIFRLKEPVD